MIKYVIAALFSASVLNAQTSSDVDQNDVKVGDVFEIGRPEAIQFEHIEFPRPNFIIKRGGIANYKKVEGNTVIVTSVFEEKDGKTKVKIKRADGNRFFGTHPVVTADYYEAVSSGELQAK